VDVPLPGGDDRVWGRGVHLDLQQHRRERLDGGDLPCLLLYFSASAAGAGTVAIVMTAGVVIASLILPRVCGLENLSRAPKHTL
jgi:hypothetical protein